ncbi:hypothetical protein BgiMline_011684 [Biomphalaria glabrata]
MTAKRPKNTPMTAKRPKNTPMTAKRPKNTPMKAKRWDDTTCTVYDFTSYGYATQHLVKITDWDNGRGKL